MPTTAATPMRRANRWPAPEASLRPVAPEAAWAESFMRVFNFSAGPAALPEPVLRQAADEMLDWQGSGMGVMEMSHRGPEFMSIHAEAVGLLRELLRVPDNYKVLFMQGGGLGENAIVPLNLLGKNPKADFVVTGSWSKKSFKEAQRYGAIRLAADGATDGKYRGIPPVASWQLDPGAAYVHICTNETIDGVEYFFTPDTGAVPLVADASSHILSRPMDVSKYGLVFGGAQKNIGPAGLTIVIVRDDLLDRAHTLCPTAFEYRTVAQHDSMYNTPPTFGIYIAGLVFKWLKAQGGLDGMEARNIAKAKLLYDTIDATGFYSNAVDPACRSRMNVPFYLRDERLNDAFLKGAKANGMVQLKGHRSVGGMRASIYNAMPLEGVEALVSYMRDFEKSNG
jgi:phosphoserine aminotransferase